MKVDSRYYCFGCHATGDVFDFTAKLFGLSNFEAAKKLAADFHIPTRGRFCQPAPPRRLSPEVAQRREEQRVADILIRYEALLKQWRTDYAPAPEAEVWDKRFTLAMLQGALVKQSLDGLFSADAEERKEALDSIRRDGRLTHMERILSEQNKEE